MIKSYQRRHLRAPLKESILYADSGYVLKAVALNISEGGILLNEIPSFPAHDEVAAMLSLPQTPLLKKISTIKLKTLSKELFPKDIMRLKARVVRREELSKNLDNIFKAKVGLEIIDLSSPLQKKIEEFVSAFSANLIHLQTLVDSYETDDETKTRVHALATLMGYQERANISKLRSLVFDDFKSLQWL